MNPIPPSPSAEGDGGIGMMPQGMMELGKNERYFFVNSILSLPFQTHSIIFDEKKWEKTDPA